MSIEDNIIYVAVGQYRFKFEWITTFIYLDPLSDGHTMARFPSLEYCRFLSGYHYKVLTRAEYDTHIAIGSLEPIDCKEVSVPYVDMDILRSLEREQQYFEQRDELDYVFDQQKQQT